MGPSDSLFVTIPLSSPSNGRRRYRDLGRYLLYFSASVVFVLVGACAVVQALGAHCGDKQPEPSTHSEEKKTESNDIVGAGDESSEQIFPIVADESSEKGIPNVAEDDFQIPFWRTSFLMAHDSATGFIQDETMRKMRQTQTVDFVGQLNCGARVLDLRLAYAAGDVLYQHAGAYFGAGFGWFSRETVKETVPAIIKWAQKNPEELVVLAISHCMRKALSIAWRKSSCLETDFTDAFVRQGARLETSCDVIRRWTYGDARKAGKMKHGGRVLVIPGEGACVEANYERNVNRADKILPYIEETMKNMKDKHMPFQVQVFNQQHLPNDVDMNLEVNKMVLNWASHTEVLKDANFIEINHICASGPTIAQSIGTQVYDDHLEKCQAACSLA